MLIGTAIAIKNGLQYNDILILKGCKKILFLAGIDEDHFWGRLIANDNAYEFKWDDIIRKIV